MAGFYARNGMADILFHSRVCLDDWLWIGRKTAHPIAALNKANFRPTASKALTRYYSMPKLAAKILATKVETEVAAFDMVVVQVPTEHFVERRRGIEGFMRSRKDINFIASVPCPALGFLCIPHTQSYLSPR